MLNPVTKNVLFHKVWRILYHTSRSSQCWSLYDNMMKHWTLYLTGGGSRCIQSSSSVILVHGDHRLMIRLLVSCLISWNEVFLWAFRCVDFIKRETKEWKFLKLRISSILDRMTTSLSKLFWLLMQLYPGWCATNEGASNTGLSRRFKAIGCWCWVHSWDKMPTCEDKCCWRSTWWKGRVSLDVFFCFFFY